MEDDLNKYFFFDPTRMMTSKINGRQPQTHTKMEDDLKKNQKMEDDLKKITKNQPNWL